jgi:protein-S-isoprenylcysteine O-methyltransferase Ste14
MELVRELDRQGNFLFKYRGILPLLILVVGLGVYAYVVWEAAGAYRPSFLDNQYEVLCLAVALLGLLIRVLTVGFTPRNTSGRNTQEQVADTLNTSGMYSIVRHPLYVGNFFMWLGVAMLTQHAWFTFAFVLLYWMYYERIMFTEEKFIAGKFKDSFYAWAQRTPAIVPNPAKWRNPDLHFNLRKVLRQEKNGVFAIFLLFFVFDTVGEYILYGDVRFRNSHWLVLCVASGLLYLVLKLLKNHTKVLAD